MGSILSRKETKVRYVRVPEFLQETNVLPMKIAVPVKLKVEEKIALKSLINELKAIDEKTKISYR